MATAVILKFKNERTYSISPRIICLPLYQTYKIRCNMGPIVVDNKTLIFYADPNRSSNATIDNGFLNAYNRNFDDLVTIRPQGGVCIVEFENGIKRRISQDQSKNVAEYSDGKIKSIRITRWGMIGPEERSQIELFTIDEIGFDSSDNTTRWIIFILILLAVYYFYKKNK